MVHRRRVVPTPTLARLRKMGAYLNGLERVRFDESLASARTDIGPSCDPCDSQHARRLRRWLNAWGCRIRYPRPGETDFFVTGFARWWRTWGPSLPRASRTLSRLTEQDIDTLAQAYEALRNVEIAPPGHRRARLGATAAAKLLSYLRPNSVPPWDATIAASFACGVDAEGFRCHLRRCRGWAREITGCARGERIAESAIGPSIGRPASSVAKLIDEYLYQVLTRHKRF